MAEVDKRVYKCVLCDRILESKEALQMHFRKHANKEIDNKGVPAKPKIIKKVIKKELPGMKNGKSAASVACDVCGQEFSRNTLAIQHKFRKHPEVSAKYFCPYCGMQFTIRALFEKHVDTHGSSLKEQESIKCEDCSAEFYTQAAQEYHHKSTHKRCKHTLNFWGYRPEVLICRKSKCFVSSARVLLKMRLLRKPLKNYGVMTIFQPVATAPPSKKIKINNAGEVQSVYYCHLCGSEYIIKFNLQKHLEKAHTEEERCQMPSDLIRCTTCDALFYNQKAYETHNIGHKPDDLYVTSEQQRLQTVTRVDQDFDIRRVLPLAAKYIPSYKNKPKSCSYKVVKTKNFKLDDENEELSPPSSPESSDSDSQSGTPSTEVTETKSDRNSPDAQLLDKEKEK